MFFTHGINIDAFAGVLQELAAALAEVQQAADAEAAARCEVELMDLRVLPLTQ